MTEYVQGSILNTLQDNSKRKKESEKEEKEDSLFTRPTLSIRPKRTLVEEVTKNKKKKSKDGESDEVNDNEVKEKKGEDDDEKEEESEDDADEIIKTERLERTIFVGNVPLNINKPSSDDVAPELPNKNNNLKKLEKALKKTFSTFGTIESIRIRSIGIKSVKVPPKSDFHTVRKVAVNKASFDERVETCNAYIVYKDKQSTLKAIENGNSSEFFGYHLRVDSAGGEGTSSSNKFDRKKTLFIGNLVFEASEEECRKHIVNLLGEDTVSSVRIVRDPVTNLGKGFAYVLLKDETIVEKGISLLNNTKIRDRAIRVTKCERSTHKKEEKLKARLDAKKNKDQPPLKKYQGKMATDPKEKFVFKKRKSDKFPSSNKKKPKRN